MLPDLGLNANGYRIRSSVPGHHIVAIRALVATFGVEDKVVRLDALRQQRNAAEYSGDLIPASAVAECIRQAEALLVLATRWLENHKPDLLPEHS